jgi:hypothetical protein
MTDGAGAPGKPVQRMAAPTVGVEEPLGTVVEEIRHPDGKFEQVRRSKLRLCCPLTPGDYRSTTTAAT